MRLTEVANLLCSDRDTVTQPLMNHIPRPEYPRPTVVRSEWLNLNGSWRFRCDDEQVGLQQAWYKGPLSDAEVITVPFAPNAAASGITGCRTDTTLWYQRDFDLPADWQDRRICLRFGAVDYRSLVFVNDTLAGEHSGGYSPFGMDIEHALVPGKNRLTVRVEDSLSWTQPRGKQAGTTRWPIDYDGVCGIWQSVWLEPLPEVSVESVFPHFSLASSRLTCLVEFSRQLEGTLQVVLMKAGSVVASAEAITGSRAESRVEMFNDAPELWSPENPHLYDLRIVLTTETGEQDEVSSYCGLREITTDKGQLRLNGEQLYIRGVLDQGYFPDGWYTATSDQDLRKDIELTLAMGFNCVRKHQKAEDPRYLYWADQLGLLVWSEMPSGRIFSTELIQALTTEWLDLIRRDRGHPSIITWVAFNESWGVWHQAGRREQRAFVEGVVGLTRALDETRPVVGNDGWEFSAGDLWTLHVYEEDSDLRSRIAELIRTPGSAVTPGEEGLGQRKGALPGASIAGLPILLTECGGIGFGHHGEDDFAYGELPATQDELEHRIRAAIRVICSATDLQGYVWTQLTDVQQEINGLLYFDRSPKLPPDILYEIFSQEP